MKKLFHTLYFKLFVIFGMTFLLILVSLMIGFRVSRPPEIRELFRENVRQYGNYLIEDVGLPPNRVRALELKQRLGIDIYIEGPHGRFGTSQEIIEAHREHCNLGKNPYSFWRRHGVWIRHGDHHEVQKGPYHIVISHRSFRDPEKSIFGMVVTGVLVFFILMMSFRFVRDVLKPVREMKRAAEAFSRGDWEARVDIDRDDELGALAKTIDQMASRIDRHFRSAKELLIAVSHELRSPLARMRLAAEFIQDTQTKNSLVEEISLLDRLTTNLLEKERVSRTDSLEVQETNLGEWMRSIVKTFPKRVSFEEVRGADVFWAIDVDRMALCLRALIENALKYSEKDVKVGVRKTEGGVHLWVQDEGPGIAVQDLEHVTEAFFRSDPARGTKRKDGGFGLGLSLCQSIVKAHGAKMEIKSRPEIGTEISILFSSSPRNVTKKE